jgi:hypothetical protein
MRLKLIGGVTVSVTVIFLALAGIGGVVGVAMSQRIKSTNRTPPSGGYQAPKIPPSSFPSSGPLNRLSGIIDSGQGPYSSMKFHVNNQWAAPNDNTNRVWTMVWAGLNNPNNGPYPSVPALIVHKQTLNPDGESYNDQELGIFAAPGAASVLPPKRGLVITAASGFVLTLTDDTGKTYRFNAMTDTYS